MKQFKLVDNLMGWIAFAIAAFVYCSTIEPTASFWDCPEFITTAYKLEVGHPPGAPFFMLTANLFTQLVDDPTMVARMVNTMSALLSATTILFLFWTITHLTRKLILKDGADLTLSKLIAIEASGMKMGTFMWPVRISLSGQKVTPGGVTELLYLLGKDESIVRLNKGMEIAKG